MIKKITSNKNKLIRNVILLQSKSRERKKQNLIVIEGRKEIELAFQSGINVKQLLYCNEIISSSEVQKMFENLSNDIQYFEVSRDVFSKISYRETTGGLVAIAETPEKNLCDLKITGKSVFVILESVEKPGNLGAIARIADGSGIDGVIVTEPLTDIYNPNAIRASLGCVFTNDIIVAEFSDVIDWLQKNKIKSYAAELKASELYHKADIQGNVAFVFGTEATGLTDRWINACDYRIKIPMLGYIDSLNVSASVAVVVYEAMRQRNFLV